MNSETSYVGTLPERHSRCAEASRKHFEAKASSLPPAMRAERERAFNAGLVQLIQAGRFQK